MNSFIRNISGIGIFVVIVTATLGMLLSNLTKKSYYDSSGSISVEGIRSTISIYSNDYGVPFIYAENENDMYFAMGYMHARDRLWQMDLYRRVAEGRLSEVLGKDMVEYDVLFRTIGIDKSASGIYHTLSSETKQILSSYTSGVNYFIENNKSRLPLEFDVLNYKPDLWTPENSIMIVRLMAWELSLSWYTDVMFGEIVKKFGEEGAADFFPSYPEDGPFIVKSTDDNTKKDTASKKDKANIDETQKKHKAINGDLANGFFELSRKFRAYLGSDAIHVGSNSWVVSGERTENRKPMLANDPHLALQSPSKWYELSLYNGQRRMSVSGFTLPGAPGVAIGHNGAVSWGLTNLMCDDADFYLLKRDSADSDKYLFRGQSLSLDSTIESIKIKDSSDDHIFTAYKTKLGPVVSGLGKTGFVNNQSFSNIPQDQILTFRWTGFEPSDEILSFYKINFAQGKEQFVDGLKTFGSPALNFVYADTSGNIAYQAAGLVPVRESSDNNAALYPSGPGIEWKGFVPFNELPAELNPEQGYIVTANNKPKSAYNHYISNLYEPHYRAKRIEEIISQSPIVTIEEMKMIQRDVQSIQAKEFCAHLFKAFGDSTSWSADIKTYLGLLSEWDFEFKSTSSAASLFAMFEAKLYENLYFAPLGEPLFENYLFLKNIPVRNTSKILDQSASLFFKTEQEKEQLLRKSFYDAVSALIGKHGPEPVNWQWGDLHKITFKHPLGIVPSFTSMLNTGPFKVSGNGTTVNNLEYGFSSALKSVSFEAYLGPSMRMIVDLSSPDMHYSILAGGQSGQPLQENYGDQARLWLNGDYKTVSNKFDDLRNESLDLFTLEPIQ